MEQRFVGQPAAPGLALGALFPLTTQTGTRAASGVAESEAEALRSALSSALTDLKGLIGQSTDDAVAILEFQVALLEDDALAEFAFSAITAGRAADRAWLHAMEQEIAGYEGSDDEYFRARAADLHDIRERVLGHLTGSGQARQIRQDTGGDAGGEDGVDVAGAGVLHRRPGLLLPRFDHLQERGLLVATPRTDHGDRLAAEVVVVRGRTA